MCRGNYKGVYPLGYVPHNPHFLWFAASMGGESKIAQDAARMTAERVNLPELMRQPGFAGLQHYWMTPWFDDVRFGRWDGDPRATEPGAGPAVRHRDLALRRGDGRRAHEPARRRRASTTRRLPSSRPIRSWTR